MTTQATTIIDKNGKTTTVHKKIPTYTASNRKAFRMPPPASSFSMSSVGLEASLAIGDFVDDFEEGMENTIGALLGEEKDVFAADKRERARKRATRRDVRRAL